MSFLARTRMFARSCDFIVQTSGVNKLTPNVIVNHIRIKGFPSVLQLRLQSTEESHVKTIYEGTLTKKMKGVKIFSLSTSLASILMQPYLLPKVLATDSTIALVGVALTTGFFSVGTPFLLNLITRKYVTRMTYDEKRDVYIATVYNIFVRKRQIEFTPDDVSKPGMREMLTTCYVHNTPLFFDFQSFTEIAHYNRILGYDKPMDFQLNEPEALKSVPCDKPKKD
ncbi:transmembrane protein 70 homolog, mitochondrial [Diachasma alloeum]|uniref:transmembrane protein 70 homolog, mitochondrial n=1 Tax=Diachasma alloeum TaxID=454923 RepID=UPI0007382E02|nr:transmembrane protein 70 homolog, mitochondrial [Diachasma alloeum]